jgi:hypothetical protein
MKGPCNYLFGALSYQSFTKHNQNEYVIENVKWYKKRVFVLKYVWFTCFSLAFVASCLKDEPKKNSEHKTVNTINNVKQK